MSSTVVHEWTGPVLRPIERKRGLWGMYLFIATEATLFAMLFFSYFYLATDASAWPPHEPPMVKWALIMLAILLTSSVILWWGEHGIRKGDVARLRIGMGATIVLGLCFLAVQILEYTKELQKLSPDSNAYGSIFYTITSLHFAHVVVGLLILMHTFARALAGHFSEHRHLAVRNASLYWHFVDAVWVVIVLMLYVSPRLYLG